MIFCFSGTGNSLYAAQRLARETGSKVVSIATALQGGDCRFEIPPGESIGFVFPIYFFALPTIVREFLSRVEFVCEDDPYVYAVFTCGATTANSSGMLKRDLRNLGLSLDAVFSVPMVDNYILLYKIADEAERRTTLLAADERLDSIAERLRLREIGDFDDCRGRFPTLLTLAAYPLYLYGRHTRKFRATEACTGCGQCAKLCPSRTIAMEGPRPAWKNVRCVHCLACANRCPVGAIEYGTATVGKGRWANPQADWKSFK